MIEKVGEAAGQGHRLYKDQDTPSVLGFVGFVKPVSQDQVVPTMRSALEHGVRWLEEQKRDKGLESIPVDAVVRYLQLVLWLSEVETGYICCPNVPDLPMPEVQEQPVDPTKGIITRFGKKLLKQRKEGETT